MKFELIIQNTYAEMRHRRRRSGSKKPPIEFYESPPLHVPLKVATPVYSSICPVTADVVPIDQIDRTWISPQFVRGSVANTKARQKRPPRKLTNCIETSCRTNGQHSLLVSKTLPVEHRLAFHPLQFIGDQPAAVANRNTPLLAVHVNARQGSRGHSSDNRAQSDNPTSKQRPSRTEDCLSISSVTPCHPNGSFCRLVPGADGETTCVPPFDVDTPDRELDANVVAHRDVGVNSLHKGDTDLVNDGLPDVESTAGFKPVTDSARDKNNCRDSICESRKAISVLLSCVLEKTPPPPAEKSSLTVLVSDTPISDYGLTYRQRVIKNSGLHTRLRRIEVT